mmetsp:Transcript_36107/g.107942  ORF Transcript_36107/g.107942 Transcript_36107/m.107942 type:complete len:318 (+) Transcript_36107:1320-2273(+)
MLYPDSRQRLPDCADARPIDERVCEAARFARRHADCGPAALLEGGEDFVDAPHALDVAGRAPRRHHRDDVADAPHTLPELGAEGCEWHRLSGLPRLLHAVLIDAEATHPAVRRLEAQTAALAVRSQRGDDVLNLVAPCVAQHEARWSRMILAAYAVDVRGSQLAGTRADLASTLRPDDHGLDVVDAGVWAQACFAHLAAEGGGQVVHTDPTVRMTQAVVRLIPLERSSRGILDSAAAWAHQPGNEPRDVHASVAVPRAREPDGIMGGLLLNAQAAKHIAQPDLGDAATAVKGQPSQGCRDLLQKRIKRHPKVFLYVA